MHAFILEHDFQNFFIKRSDGRYDTVRSGAPRARDLIWLQDDLAVEV